MRSRMRATQASAPSCAVAVDRDDVVAERAGRVEPGGRARVAADADLRAARGVDAPLAHEVGRPVRRAALRAEPVRDRLVGVDVRVEVHERHRPSVGQPRPGAGEPREDAAGDRVVAADGDGARAGRRRCRRTQSRCGRCRPRCRWPRAARRRPGRGSCRRPRARSRRARASAAAAPRRVAPHAAPGAGRAPSTRSRCCAARPPGRRRSARGRGRPGSGRGSPGPTSRGPRPSSGPPGAGCRGRSPPRERTAYAPTGSCWRSHAASSGSTMRQPAGVCSTRPRVSRRPSARLAALRSARP